MIDSMETQEAVAPVVEATPEEIAANAARNHDEAQTPYVSGLVAAVADELEKTLGTEGGDVEATRSVVRAVLVAIHSLGYQFTKV